MNLTIQLERKAKPGHGGGTPALYLVRDDAGAIVGLLEKYRNTRTDTHPWKAWHGHGMEARFLGAFYADADGPFPAAAAVTTGGSAAALAAIRAALELAPQHARAVTAAPTRTAP